MGMADLGPAIEARIRVFWTGERRWFKGTVTKATTEGGKTIHRILYDDMEVRWHDLADEIWLLLTGKAAEKRLEPSDARASMSGKRSRCQRPKTAPPLSGPKGAFNDTPSSPAPVDAAVTAWHMHFDSQYCACHIQRGACRLLPLVNLMRLV